MKKTCLILFLSFLSNINGQEVRSFVFVKTTIARIEKYAAYSDDYSVRNAESKKRMQGMYLINNSDGKVDYNTTPYVKFSDIPITDKFIMITDAEYGIGNVEKNLIIQNIKSKQLYCISAYAIRDYQDSSNSINLANGNGWLTKYLPKEFSSEEKQLLSKYKNLIKSTNSNMLILSSIQKKYVTKGYFNSSNVSKTDRVTYNNNLVDLKKKANQLEEIDRYEDKDDKAQNRLTQQEIVMLVKINDWNSNFQKI
jgi:hypothetical protein